MLLKCNGARPPRHLAIAQLRRWPCGADIRPPPHPRLAMLSISSILPPVSHLFTTNISLSAAFSRLNFVSDLCNLHLNSFRCCDRLAMALAMNVRTNVGSALAAPVVAGVSSFKQATSVRFNNGAVVFKRASLVVRAASDKEPGPAGRDTAPGPQTTPAGMSGLEAPLSVITKSAPLDQGSDNPVGERIAYVCQDCGYVYKDEKPFEDVSEDYNCPRCAAPKARFSMANASVDEMLDTTEEDDAVTRGGGVNTGGPSS